MQKGLYCQKESWYTIMISDTMKKKIKNEPFFRKMSWGIYYDDGWILEEVPNFLLNLESFMHNNDKDIQ